MLRPRFFCANAFSRTGYTYVNFIPTLGKTAVDGDVKDILILNTSGTLVHPTATGNMKGFRAYFVMHEAASAREFIMNFGDGEIVTLRVNVDENVAEGDYPILLKAMKLTESDIRNFYTADEIETTVTVCYDLTTRINKAGNGASSKEAEVYDLAGRKVEKPVQKGVYIVGGHKLLKR